MHHLSTKLFTSNIVGLIVWMENAQTVFGFLGAVVGLFSAVMLVFINWDKFMASKPLARLRNYFSQ